MLGVGGRRGELRVTSSLWSAPSEGQSWTEEGQRWETEKWGAGLGEQSGSEWPH